MSEINGFKVARITCGGCERVIDTVVGHDDECYCPICDPQHVNYMAGEAWRYNAIQSAKKLSELSKEDWSWYYEYLKEQEGK